MIEIITFLTIITMTLLTTRIGAVALSLTGLSDTVARFQARSALSGVGFTTTEAESITSDHRRRKIIMKLMLIGNVGIVSLVATGLLSFMHISKNFKDWRTVSVFLAGLALLWFLATSKTMEKLLRKFIQKFFRKYTTLTSRNYEDILRLNGNFVLVEIPVTPKSWLNNKTISETKLHMEGIVILGIHRASGDYIGIPQKETLFKTGDLITLYGHSEQITKLHNRKAGEKGEESHLKSIKNNKEMIAENPK